MDYQQLITFIMEMVGTIAFAASGAMVAVDRAMDIFGVIVLGVTTAVGGGAVRDVILGIVPPAMFQHPVYTVVATVTSCVVFMILYLKKELLQGHNRETYDKVMLVMDSIGLGIFTVVGVNTGIAHDIWIILSCWCSLAPSQVSAEDFSVMSWQVCRRISWCAIFMHARLSSEQSSVWYCTGILGQSQRWWEPQRW